MKELGVVKAEISDLTELSPDELSDLSRWVEYWIRSLTGLVAGY